MLTLAFYLFLLGFALFLLGFSVFMYIEGRKFGDNQFTMKLLPPPPKVAQPTSARFAAMTAFSVREESAPTLTRKVA